MDIQEKIKQVLKIIESYIDDSDVWYSFWKVNRKEKGVFCGKADDDVSHQIKEFVFSKCKTNGIIKQSDSQDTVDYIYNMIKFLSEEIVNEYKRRDDNGQQ